MEKEILKLVKGPSQYANNASIELLTQVLQYCLDIYENGKTDPVISDDNYDIMLDILEIRDPNSEFLKKTKKTDDESYAMPSLNKIRAHIKGEFESWYPGDKTDHYQVCDKLDGISAKLVIKNGIPKLTTKGRGTKPQDITNKIPLIDFGTDLSKFRYIVVRGEIIIPKKFAHFFVESKDNSNQNDKALNVYKDPRSAVSGIMNNKKVLTEYKGKLDFVVHFKYGGKYNSYKEMFENVASIGFKTPWNETYSKLSREICTEILHKRRIESEYIIDGIVIPQNIQVQEPTGDNPKDVMAFKDISETAQSTVIDIIWTIGQYGYLTPVLIIEPVIMDNATINNATAHNAKYVIDNQIGIGSIIEISHEVTPQVQKVITQSIPKMPEMEYVWNSTKKHIYCKEETVEQIVAEVRHFFKVLKLKFLSDGIIKTLNNSGYPSIIDIITADRKELYEIKGLGKTVIDKIYNGMELQLNSAKLETLMAGSCLFGRNLGEKKLKLIVDEIPNVMNCSKEDLKPLIMEIKGFSEISTEKFLENFDNFKEFLENLTSTGKIINYFECIEIPKIEEIINIEHPIRGKKIVFTNIRAKDDLKNNIEKNGGIIMTSVSGKTDIVVYPASKTDSSSITKARELKIELLEMSQFLNKYQL